MYFGLALCLSLAAFLLCHAVGTLIMSGLWRLLATRTRQWPAQDRARTLFALRAVPLLGAALFTKLFVLPSYFAHEPRAADESLGWPLLLLALVATAGLSLALWRGIAAWRVTRRLLRDWLANAQPIVLEDVKIPAYCLRHPFPVVAIVGITRPRLFVSEQVLATLSQEELAVTIRHELGHLATRDNLKRAWLRVCGDVLTLVPCGRGLDRDWAATAESAADEHATNNQAAASLTLASALLKVARLAPPGAHPALPAGAFLWDSRASALVARVHYLTRLADAPPAMRRFRWDTAIWLGLFSFAALMLLAAWQTPALAVLHSLLERVVRL